MVIRISFRNSGQIGTVDGFGKKPRARGLPYSTGPRKKISVSHTVHLDRVHKRADHVLLSHHLIEAFGPVFSIEYLFAHDPSITRNARKKQKTHKVPFGRMWQIILY